MNKQAQDKLTNPEASVLISLGELEEPEGVIKSLNKTGWQIFRLNRDRSVIDKQTLLADLAKTCRFPDYFGSNWDATIDCLSDLSWLPARGYIVIFEAPEGMQNHDPEAFRTFLDVAEDVGCRWRKHKIPFKVILA